MGLLSGLVDAARLESGEIDGEAPALSDGTTALTWREYVDRVAGLAAVLGANGVRPGDRVGVRLSKSCTSFVAVHAVMRAGAVMVPLDPMAPTAAASQVIGDADIEVLITDRRTAEVAGELGSLRTLVLPGVAGLAGVDPTAIAVLDQTDIDVAEPCPAVAVAPDAPAYIIYTSGSTGRPKGIVHTHASALAYVRAAADEYDLCADDRFANIAPLHFDQSTFELYAASFVGGSVLVVPDPVLRFPASVSELIARERVTIWYSVPYLLEQLADRGVLDERDLTPLRWVLFGGESFPHRSLASLMRMLPRTSFSNVYGPAEVNQCTAHLVEAPPDRPVPIGQAWSVASIRVVDPEDHATEVPVGSPGVLLVASATMMQGYWNRADLTATATSTDADGVRWYVTGDLVRADDHGVMTFLGRVDNQVKLRGFRIELEAVDAALRAAPGVGAATTVVDRPEDGDDRLVALVELLPTEHPTEVIAAIGDTLRLRLPRYAIPGEIRPVQLLPRTSTGKIDRNVAADLLALRA